MWHSSVFIVLQQPANDNRACAYVYFQPYYTYMWFTVLSQMWRFNPTPTEPIVSHSFSLSYSRAHVMHHQYAPPLPPPLFNFCEQTVWYYAICDTTYVYALPTIFNHLTCMGCGHNSSTANGTGWVCVCVWKGAMESFQTDSD